MRPYHNALRSIILRGAPVLSCAAVCAQAEVVEYQVTFDATWSQATHPQDFPPSPHFSGLIGGTHNAAVTFWQEGELATTGIENMAELGSKTALTDEVNAAIGDAYVSNQRYTSAGHTGVNACP